MRIGVISDTHDRQDAVREAFSIFQREGITHVLHLGDIIAPFVLRWIREVYEGKLTLVLGNNDGEKLFLKKTAASLGMDLHVPPHLLPLHRRTLLMLHEPVSVQALARGKAADVILYGHTHEVHQERVQDILILNPGEACGWLHGQRTAAFLNLENLEVELFSF
jgi:putative phosphoesterase